MNWRDAYFEQAESDFRLANHLHALAANGTYEFCHQLHYFQMATEKLAKWFLTDGRNITVSPPHRSHQALSRFLQICKGKLELWPMLKYPNKSSYVFFINRLLPLAREIENLAPVGGVNKPNPEYPWYDSGSESIVTPARYPFPGLYRNPNMVELQNFLNRLIRLKKAGRLD